MSNHTTQPSPSWEAAFSAGGATTAFVEDVADIMRNSLRAQRADGDDILVGIDTLDDGRAMIGSVGPLDYPAWRDKDAPACKSARAFLHHCHAVGITNGINLVAILDATYPPASAMPHTHCYKRRVSADEPLSIPCFLQRGHPCCVVRARAPAPRPARTAGKWPALPPAPPRLTIANKDRWLNEIRAEIGKGANTLIRLRRAIPSLTDREIGAGLRHGLRTRRLTKRKGGKTYEAI